MTPSREIVTSRSPTNASLLGVTASEPSPVAGKGKASADTREPGGGPIATRVPNPGSACGEGRETTSREGPEAKPSAPGFRISSRPTSRTTSLAPRSGSVVEKSAVQTSRRAAAAAAAAAESLKRRRRAEGSNPPISWRTRASSAAGTGMRPTRESHLETSRSRESAGEASKAAISASTARSRASGAAVRGRERSRPIRARVSRSREAQAEQSWTCRSNAAESSQGGPPSARKRSAVASRSQSFTSVPSSVRPPYRLRGGPVVRSLDIVALHHAHQGLLQGLVRPRESRLHGPHRTAQDLGNLLVGETLDVTQDHDGSELRAKVVDCPLNLSLQFLPVRPALGAAAPIAFLFQLFHRHRLRGGGEPPRDSSPPEVDRGVDRDPVHPGGKLR